jgi:hypothetical protein
MGLRLSVIHGDVGVPGGAERSANCSKSMMRRLSLGRRVPRAESESEPAALVKLAKLRLDEAVLGRGWLSPLRWLFCAVLARREAMLRLRGRSTSAGVMTAGALPELILWLIDGRGASSRPVAAGALLVLACCVIAGR